MFITNSSILLILSLICITANANQGLVGQSCVHKGKEGVCKSIIHCEKPCAKAEERLSPCDPSRRGIVCCPNPRNVEPISAKKCQEYKERVCSVHFVGNTPGRLTKNKVYFCAANTEAVIMNGENAALNEFPHMALVGYIKDNITNFVCGGSLISHYFVLTAAHCLRPVRLGNVTHVRLGEHDESKTDETNHEDFDVVERIPHENYTARSFYYDIGLLKLGKKVVFNPRLRPLCLPEINTFGSRLIAAGWGHNGTNTRSEVLSKVSLEVFDHNKCSKENEPFSQLRRGINEETQFCAGSTTASNNTCKGDSGGPLVHIHPHYNCTYVIEGITSFGGKCVNDSRSIGAYTRVSYFVEWIENIVWPNILEP
ncbi:Serine protease snake [Pseudolycoriella hygida]|uniref:Serine protease snake n=1 Tax=Pseudolycoriella hygida TaxID=35572 RepID=A0A9Q0N1T5_9DIPT|nr:Serine protease snake [Pseudolycoriella hygida]